MSRKKKKFSWPFLDALEKLRKKRQLQKVKDRMKSIIKTTVGEEIKLEKGKNWSYDPDNKTIYYVEDGSTGIKELPTSNVIGIMLHEISHAKYSQEINRVAFPDPQRAYASLVNATEDARVERKLMDRFPGTYDTFEDKMQLAEQLLDANKVKQLPPHINLLYNYLRSRWDLPKMFTDKKIEEVFDKVKPLLDEAVAQDTTNEMEEQLYSKVWKYIEDIIPPPDPNQPPPEGGNDEQQEGEDKDEQEQPQGGGGSSNQDEQEEEEKEDSGGGGGGGQDEKEDDKEDEENDEDEDEQEEGGGQGEDEQEEEQDKEFQDKVNNSIDMDDIQDMLQDKSKKQAKPKSMFDEADEDVTKDNTMDAIQEEDFEPPTQTGGAFGNADFKSYEELYADIASHIPYFVKKINSIMTDNKLSRSGGAYRSGKLNTKTLYKWKTNNPKLFKRKVMRQHKDYSVYLLVDQSGSMSQFSKNKNAARATILMSEVLKKSGIDFAIRGFNLDHKVYKTFNQAYNWKVKRALENIIPATGRSGAGGNNDGYNINVAAHELSKRTGEKILIVISDGRPNPDYDLIPQEDRTRLKGNYSHYDDFDLKGEITKAKQDITLIGVGINARYVADFYPQAVLCDDIEELPNQLLNILRKNIRRG